MTPDSPSTRDPWWRRLFVGPQGLRAGWRLLLFAVLFTLIGGALGLFLDLLGVGLRVPWQPGELALQEGKLVLAAILAMLPLLRLERRRFAAYGLGWSSTSARELAAGTLWGLATPALVVLGIWALGGVELHGIALAPAAIAVQAVLWASAFAAIAAFEEIAFRGYVQRGLADGIGFWPAALVLSLVFGALHYFGKPDESWLDAVAVVLIGLFLCLTLRRTGALWFAIGLHLGFNFCQMFLLGGPNSGNLGQPVTGHLLDTRWVGPRLLTGGPTGIESSVLMLPAIGLLFALFLWRYGPRESSTISPAPAGGSAASSSRAAG